MKLRKFEWHMLNLFQQQLLKYMSRNTFFLLRKNKNNICISLDISNYQIDFNISLFSITLRCCILLNGIAYIDFRIDCSSVVNMH